MYLFCMELLFCYCLHTSLTLPLIVNDFVHMYRINTHCFNFFFDVFLGCLYLYFMYHITSFAVAYLLEMSHLATTPTCLPTLPWQVHSATILTWWPLQCLANQGSSGVFLCHFGYFYFVKLPQSVSVFNTAACTLCTSTFFTQVSTPPLVMRSSLLVAVSSFIISSNMCLSLRPWMNCSLSCLSCLLVITLYCCYVQPSHPLLHVYILISIPFSELEQFYGFVILGFELSGQCFK